jgi:hypothetical protein
MRVEESFSASISSTSESQKCLQNETEQLSCVAIE